MGALGALQKIVVADAHALRGRWACTRGQVSVGGGSHEAEGEGRGLLSPARDTTSPKMRVCVGSNAAKCVYSEPSGSMGLT